MNKDESPHFYFYILSTNKYIDIYTNADICVPDIRHALYMLSETIMASVACKMPRCTELPDFDKGVNHRVPYKWLILK